MTEHVARRTIGVAGAKILENGQTIMTRMGLLAMQLTQNELASRLQLLKLQILLLEACNK